MSDIPRQPRDFPIGPFAKAAERWFDDTQPRPEPTVPAQAATVLLVRGEPVEVFGVDEVLTDERRGVRIRDDVVVEVRVRRQDVVDERTEEDDVGATTDGDVLVGHRRGAGEPRIDVDHRGAAGFCLSHPLESDRVALGHVRALDDDAVSVGQILLVVRGTTTPERGSQTGNGGGVSNSGLVLHLDGAERRVELLHEVVLLIVQRRPAEAG
mgnify:CR=1 FL=1